MIHVLTTIEKQSKTVRGARDINTNQTLLLSSKCSPSNMGNSKTTFLSSVTMQRGPVCRGVTGEASRRGLGVGRRAVRKT